MIKDSEWGSSKRPTISQEQHAPLPQAWFEELSGMGGGGRIHSELDVSRHLLASGLGSDPSRPCR